MICSAATSTAATTAATATHVIVCPGGCSGQEGRLEGGQRQRRRRVSEAEQEPIEL